jgi:hypothetical protein
MCVSGGTRWDLHEQPAAAHVQHMVQQPSITEIQGLSSAVKPSYVQHHVFLFVCRFAGPGGLHERPAAADALAAAQECVQALLSRQGGMELLLSEQPR